MAKWGGVSRCFMKKRPHFPVFPSLWVLWSWLHLYGQFCKNPSSVTQERWYLRADLGGLQGDQVCQKLVSAWLCFRHHWVSARIKDKDPSKSFSLRMCKTRIRSITDNLSYYLSLSLFWTLSWLRYVLPGCRGMDEAGFKSAWAAPKGQSFRPPGTGLTRQKHTNLPTIS